MFHAIPKQKAQATGRLELGVRYFDTAPFTARGLSNSPG